MGAEGLEVYTIGHSNRSIGEFIDILKAYGIEVVVDIRRFPTSKWPWFRAEELKASLEAAGIGYAYLGDLLGGYREGGYPAYMESERFREGLRKLIEIARLKKAAIMCSERIVYRCHRRFVSRALQEMGARVIHIVDKGRSFEAPLLSGRNQG